MTTTPEKQVTFGFRPATAEEIAVTTPEAEGIEETHNTREVEEIIAQLLLRTYDRCFVRGRVPPEVGSSIAHYDLFLKEELTNLLHQQLQKAREGFKERIDDFLNGMKAEINISNEYKLGYRQALLDLKKAYHSELDQDEPISITSAQKEEEVSQSNLYGHSTTLDKDKV